MTTKHDMKLAIMQPYFFPYIGYFQLIAAADLFVLYDNIKYTKKGWINRNRMLQNGKDVMFSLPLKSDSDYLYVCNRELSSEFNPDKLLNQFKGAYQRAPYFSETFSVVERIVRYEDKNLFNYLHNSITELCTYLGITTEIKVSSEVKIDHELKSQNKVLAFCEALSASAYINSIGGAELYSKDVFSTNRVDLSFIKSSPFHYEQFGGTFVPWLSILDVMMFNPIDTIQTCIFTNYELI